MTYCSSLAARLCGLLLLAAPFAFAQVPTLSDTFQPPEPDITALGFGEAVEPLDDVDGDGTPDLAVGGFSAFQDGQRDVGRAYVISGATGAVIHTLTPPTPTLQGRFGDNIANLGDLNADGTDDFVVTGQGDDIAGDGSQNGAAYVYSGATGTLLYTLASPSPEAGGDFGSDASAAGDLNGDGLQDILVGALNENDATNGGGAGQVHVFSGADGAFIRTITPPFEPTGNIFSFFGRDVFLVGDLDGDGTRDHAVHTRFGGGGGGRVDFFSGATGTPIDFLISPFTTVGADFGAAIVSFPDLNGDGVDEVVIGAPGAEPFQTFPPFEGTGVVTLVDGATRATIREFRPGRMAGAEPGGMGAAIAVGEDLDNDFVRDLYFGAPGADVQFFPPFLGSNAGRVYAFSTATGAALGNVASPNTARNGVFGNALALADLDGSGTEKLLIGAPGEGMGDPDGRIYVYDQTVATPIVADGSFELGTPNPFWSSFGIPSDPICSVATCGPNEGIEAFDGEWFLFFGRAIDATTGFAQQEVTIPDSVNTLSFYLKIPVAETAGNVRALIDGEILFEATQMDADAFASYRRVDVDITEYADGGSHTLRFQSATVSANPPGRMFFFVDAVSINRKASNAGFAANPDEVGFGNVPVGTVAQQNVTITNTGTDPLVISDVIASPLFGDPARITTDAVLPLTVAAGESTVVTVFYAPTDETTTIVELQFVSNAVTSPDIVTAGGTGFIESDFSVDPDSLAFTVAAGSMSDPQTLMLTNSGTSAGVFSITTTVTPPGALAPTTLTPAGRLRTLAASKRAKTPSVYQRGSGGDLVTDGSFEATDPGTRDNPFWDEFSAQQGSPFCDANCFGQDLARTGDWFSIFGFDVELGTDFIEQEVDLAAQSYDLTLFYAGGTDRDGDGVEEAEGFFRIFVDDALIYELSAEEAQDFTLDYQQLAIPFEVAEAGMKTLRIEFEQIVANPEDDVMQIIFDDVSLAPSTLRLAVDPRIGTVGPGETQEIAVTADATDAAPGTYAAELRIDTDDADTPTILVPVTVQVTASGGIAINIEATTDPVVIPAEGGSFAFAVTLTNATGEAQTFQAWTEATFPDGSVKQPGDNDLLGPVTVTLAPGQTATRQLIQEVPAGIPAGDYVYTGLVGAFPDGEVATDGFPGVKLPANGTRTAPVVTVWRILNAETGSVVEAGARWGAATAETPAAASTTTPEVFALRSAYPNPFAGRTTIGYDLPEATSVRAEVYDVTGRRVATLVDEPQAAGRYEVEWDARSLPSGVYLVRLSAGSDAATQRITLLR